MTIDQLLGRLEGVKRTRAGGYVARCPAHEDRSPSLAAREVDDGRILLKCFGGCSTEEVLSSIGLAFPDLYPAKTIPHTTRQRRPFPAADVLLALTAQFDLAVLYMSKMARGEALSEHDKAALLNGARMVNQGVWEAGHG